MSLEVDFSGLHAKVRALRAAAADVTPALEKWGDDVAEQTARRFDEHDWALRADGTPADLEETGRLRQSLQRPMAVERVERHGAEFGTDVFYGRFIERGAEGKGRRVLPARPFLEMTPELAAKLKGRIADHLTGRHGA